MRIKHQSSGRVTHALDCCALFPVLWYFTFLNCISLCVYMYLCTSALNRSEASDLLESRAVAFNLRTQEAEVDGFL